MKYKMKNKSKNLELTPKNLKKGQKIRKSQQKKKFYPTFLTNIC